jgi:hypothetical protein
MRETLEQRDLDCADGYSRKENTKLHCHTSRDVVAQLRRLTAR